MLIAFVGKTFLWYDIVFVIFIPKYCVHFILFEYILNQSVEMYSILKLFCINKAL